jgi:hypothetical protein
MNFDRIPDRGREFAERPAAADATRPGRKEWKNRINAPGHARYGAACCVKRTGKGSRQIEMEDCQMTGFLITGIARYGRCGHAPPAYVPSCLLLVLPSSSGGSCHPLGHYCFISTSHFFRPGHRGLQMQDCQFRFISGLYPAGRSATKRECNEKGIPYEKKQTTPVAQCQTIFAFPRLPLLWYE